MLAHISAFSSLLELPELQHHVIWDLPGRGGARGHLLPPHLMPTSCSAPNGSRPEAKEKIYFLPLGFFSSSSIFFSKRSYFLQWFYTEGKTQAKKKVSISILSPSHTFPVSALKSMGFFLQGAQGKDCFYNG